MVPNPHMVTAKQPASGPRSGKIDHVVIIVKENHCFDNYFGTFPGADGMVMPRSPNPPTQDPNHRHDAWLTRQSTAVREQFVAQDIPAYFAYAREFTLCDNYFTDVAGPSTPNHLMLIAAASPIIVNPHYRDPIKSQPPFNIPSLPAALKKAGLTWGNYGGYAQGYITALKASKHNLTADKFAPAAAAGKLPTVSWVYGPTGLSEHPVELVKAGEKWTAD